jgi:hypothetical protein
VAPDEDRQQQLVVARVAWQIGMLQDIGAVLVVLVMGQQEADLVQAGGTFEHVSRLLASQTPSGAHLAQQIERRRADPLGLRLRSSVKRRMTSAMVRSRTSSWRIRPSRS